MTLIKKIYGKIRSLRIQKGYHNGDITILTPNCLGGVLYHWLGLKFNSPTINLWMFPKDFCKFVCNLDYYISQEVVEIDSDRDYPVGRLGNGSDAISIFFQHYGSFEEAKNKWDVRKQRILKDKIYVITTDRDGISAEDIERFSTSKVHKIVVFTAKEEYLALPNTLLLSAYRGCDQVGNFMIDDRSSLLGKYAFEKDFNVLQFFND